MVSILVVNPTIMDAAGLWVGAVAAAIRLAAAFGAFSDGTGVQ
jgi:xanthine/uracil/vitamin C permease (AzgA family)